MLKRILFKRIELWVVGLIIFMGALAFLSAPMFIADIIKRDSQRLADLNSFEKTVVFFAELPEIASQILDPYRLMRSPRKFGDRAGLTVRNSDAKREGYHLLLSRFDGDLGRSIVELIDLNSKETVHKWMPSFDGILADANIKEKPERASHYRMMSPILQPDGSLIFIGPPLIKVDVCGGVVWNLDGDFHHSAEVDSDGNFWVPQKLSPKQITAVGGGFVDDGITKISPDGKILYTESIAKILIEKDLRSWILTYDNHVGDPIHLNDIQPVNFDGPFWKKGDLFLSLGHLNTVLLFRPSTREIVWSTRDGLEHQHDVDIIDDHRISIFDNNTWMTAQPKMKTQFNYADTFDTNDVAIYDFRTKQYSRPYREALKKISVRTITQGLADVLPNGNLYFEETDFGRVGEVTKEGSVIWEFINKSKNGEVFITNWGKILNPDQSKKLLGFVSTANCNQRLAGALPK